MVSARGRRVLAGAVALGIAAAAAGVVIGHYAWNTDSTSSSAASGTPAPQSRGGAPPGRLDPNLRAVLSSPRIHNLFWDSAWSTRAAHAGFTRGQIRTATMSLAAGSFMNAAAQYGVGRAAFAGSNGPHAICGALRAPVTISATTVQAWVTCMATSVVSGVPLPIPRAPVSNDLYVVYLPARTTISDNLSVPAFTVLGQTFGPYTILIKTSCTDYGAYHFASSAISGPFAYAVVPTKCFSGDAAPLDSITVAASHELIEAATDPFPLAGWINNNVTLGGFSRLIRGEAADICSPGGAVPTGAVQRGVLVARYWSNSAGACF